MTLTPPQRTITISIIGTGADARVLYSYWSPVSGMTYTNSSTCDMEINTATNSLFLLDYISSNNGWIIVNTTPSPPGAPELQQLPGPNQQSIMLIDPYSTPSTFKFFINYRNTVTNAPLSEDPQEGNIPPMY